MSAQRVVRLALLLCTASFLSTARSQDLPVPCAAGNCGLGPEVFVTQGDATYSVSGDVGTIRQFSDRAILNWQSFDVADGKRVVFEQPRDISVALNRIYSQSPSRILGAVDANGQVYLINPNGIIFGEGARVNTNTLLASSLNINDDVFNESGLLGALDIEQGVAALEANTDAAGDIVVEDGALLQTKEGGQILLFAPKVVNAGSLRTPGGQTILAASEDRVYLQFSDDPELRGFLVEVGTGGEVSNLGDIVAERGDVTMAGVLVQQQGVIQATSTVQENGSIRLLARDNALPEPAGGGRNRIRAQSTGTLIAGSNSVTEVLPDFASTDTAVDAQNQRRPSIEFMGREVRLESNALVRAPGGEINIAATLNPRRPLTRPGTETLLSIGEGAVIDASGVDSTVVPMSRNSVEVDLRANELADAPLQREGAARGETVSVDIRRGTNFANVNEATANIPRTIGERLSAGGSVTLGSEDRLEIAESAIVDVSGGAVTYEAGFVDSTRVVLDDGRVIDISDADPDQAIVGVFSGASKTHDAWGVTETFVDPTGTAQSSFEPGYVEGKDAGEVLLRAVNMDVRGDIRGGSTAGIHQRQPTDADTDVNPLARPYQQVPDQGRLSIDLNGYESFALDTQIRAVVDEALDFDDGDVVPDVILPASLLATSNFSRYSISTLGQITVGDDVSVDFTEGAELDLIASAIDFAGRFAATSGRFSFRTQLSPFGATDTSLLVRAGSRLDVSGNWINDNPYLQQLNNGAPLWIDGGTVDLESVGDLFLSSQAVLQANGGAHFGADQQLRAGVGGSLRLASTSVAGETQFVLGSNLSAYALEQGGSIEVEANSLALFELGLDDALPLVPSPDIFEPVNPGPPLPELDFIPKFDASLPSFFFNLGGFENYRIISNRYGIVAMQDSNIEIAQSNYQLRPDFILQPSASTMNGVATVRRLALEQRRPANLELLYQPVDQFTEFDGFGIITMPGSMISLDPGASLALRSGGSIWLQGGLTVPGGSVDVQTLGFGVARVFAPRQQLRLSSGSQIDVSGTFVSEPNALELRLGRLYDGGEVSVDAAQGYLVVEPQARIDVSNATAVVDIPRVDGSRREAVEISSNAGSVFISSAEGGYVDGVLQALTQGAGGLGGELTLAVNASRRNVPVDNLFINPSNQFPDVDRILEISDNLAIPEFMFRDVLPLEQLGRLSVSLRPNSFGDRFSVGGFDVMRLAVQNVVNDGRVNARDGVLRFVNDLEFNMGRRLHLDSAFVDVAGSRVDLSAPYLSLGATTYFPTYAGGGSGGDGRLRLRADFLDLTGFATVNGAAQVQLRSATDVRLQGFVNGPEARSITGDLQVHGDLSIVGQRLYPTTLSQFSMSALGDRARIDFASADGAPGSSLFSYGGGLSVEADELFVDSQLLAPGGRLALTAGSGIELGEGARLSTELTDELTLFGRTQGGFDWVYPLGNARVLAFDGLTPTQVALSAPNINAALGSTIDVDGGGALAAYEFIPGPGGTADVLAASAESGAFVILPKQNLDAAAVDVLESDGFQYAPGTGLRIATDTDVAVAGEYAVLPARYALLPGSVLVTPVPVANELFPGEVRRDADGAPIVAGHLTGLGSGIGEGRWHGYKLQEREVALARSEFSLTSASQFFVNDGVGQSTTPNDAGTVNLSAGAELNFAGRVSARGLSEGRDGALAFSADRLAVIGAEQDPIDDYVNIRDVELREFDVGEVVVGGNVELSPEGDVLNTLSDEVLVTAEVDLQQRGLLLSANERLVVEGNARLAAVAEGGAPRDRQLQTDDSVNLVVLSRDRFDFTQNAGTAVDTGEISLEIGEGASLTGLGTLAVRSAQDARLDGALEVVQSVVDLRAASFALGGSNEGTGEAADSTAGSVLSQATLDALSEASELRISGRNQLSIADDVTLQADLVRLDAPRVVTQGAALQVLSNRFELRNTQGAPTSDSMVPDGDATTLAGRFAVDAQQVVLGPGDLRLDGFADTSIAAAAGIRVEGEQNLGVDGALSLETPVLRATAASILDIVAGGPIRLSQHGQPALADELQGLPEFGGRISLSSPSDVVLASRIEATSGVLEVVAGGDSGIQLAAGAVLDVAGRTLTADIRDYAAPAGQVSLDALVGSVSLEQGSRISLLAQDPAPGGSLAITAQSGRIDLLGEVVANSGARLLLDGAALSGLDSVLTGAGFDGAQVLRQRQGDLQLDAGGANRVDISVDAGTLLLSGDWLAQGDDALFTLSGRDGVTIAGSLDANRPGAIYEVNALSSTASVSIPGAVRGEAARLRVRTLMSGNVNERINVAGTLDVEQRTLELVRVADWATEVLTPDEFAVLRGDVELEFNSASQALGSLATQFDVAPGLWLRTPATLTLAGPLDLSDWRLGDTPGRLLISTGGDINVEGGISDGFRLDPIVFDGGSIDVVALQEDASWGIELIAGADSTAANPWLTAAPVDPLLNPLPGSLRIGSNSRVRTGSGDIVLRAAGDITLADASSTVYVAGINQRNGDISDFYNFVELHDFDVPTAGGYLDIQAQGDVQGAASEQLFVHYLARYGGSASIGDLPTMSGVVFDAFRQNFASFGGGALRLSAGGDLREVAAVAPLIIRHVGDAQIVGDTQPGMVAFSDNSYELLGATTLRIEAAGDVIGGVFYAGRGTASIRADRMLTGADGIGAVLGTAGASWNLLTQRDLNVETLLNPTSLPLAPSLQSARETNVFFSYTPDARLDAQALTGDLRLGNDVTALVRRSSGPFNQGASPRGLDLYPSSVNLTAATGNVEIFNDLTLFPGAGSLLVLARDSVLAPQAGSTLRISDADPNLLPSIDNPASDLIETTLRIPTALIGDPALLYARTPIHIDDNERSGIQALNGSISMAEADLVSAEAFAAIAAGDVSLNRVNIQNTKASDVTTIQSGGDVQLLAARDPDTGVLLSIGRVFQVAGPGRLEVLAGRSVDLGTSVGIETVGDLENPALADSGADVLVVAGNAGEPQIDPFLEAQVISQREVLDEYAERFGVDLPDAESARVFFDGLSQSQRREIAFEQFFLALRTAGQLASQLIAEEAPAADIELAYARGREAIETLFPDNRSYNGNVSLFFSKITTLDGGDISLLVPGGLVNAGLAASAGFGLNKPVSELGIVAQRSGDVNIFADGDIAVNQSRVFTLNGGDINLWSATGNIDAGRGAKTVLARPGLIATLGENDTIVKVLPPGVAGSGIAADDGDSGRLPDILLSTPEGVVDAGDAGIRTPGRLFTAATDVVGRDNISVGSFVGAPADTVVLSSDLASVGDTAASATSSIVEAAADDASEKDSSSSLADSALGWLEVFLEGFGSDFCDSEAGDECS